MLDFEDNRYTQRIQGATEDICVQGFELWRSLYLYLSIPTLHVTLNIFLMMWWRSLCLTLTILC